MGYGRYTDIRIQPVVPEISLQEATFAPLQRQQRRDNMYDKLAQMNAEVNRTKQDDPLVSQQIAEFDQRRKAISERIAKSPNDPSLANELFGLSQDINKFKTTGIGFHAQQAYNLDSTARATYLDIATKAGWDPEKADINFKALREKQLKEGRAGAFRDGKLIDYQSNNAFNIPKYIDVNNYIKDLYTSAGGKNLKELSGSNMSVQYIDTPAGKIPMLRVTDWGKVDGDNRAALQAVQDTINAQLENPNSDLNRAIQYSGQTPEEVLKQAISMGGMFENTIDKDMSKTNYQNIAGSTSHLKEQGEGSSIYVPRIGNNYSSSGILGIGSNDTASMTTEDKVQTYLKMQGVDPTKYSSLANASKGLVDLANSLGNNAEMIYSIGKAAVDGAKILDLQSQAVAPGTKFETVEEKNKAIWEAKLEAKANFEKISNKFNEGGVNATKALQDFNKAFDDMMTSDVEIPAEAQEGIVRDLSTYFENDPDLKAEMEANNFDNPKEFFEEKIQNDPETINRWMSNLLDSRVQINNDTYLGLPTNGDTKTLINAKHIAEAHNYRLETGDIPSKVVYSPNNPTVPIDFNELKEEGYTFSYTGVGGIGNVTEAAGAWRLVAKNEDGVVAGVFYMPDDSYSEIDVISQDLHNIAKSIKTSPNTYGSVTIPYTNAEGDPVETIVNWKQVKGRGYVFEDYNGNEIGVAQDPVDFIMSF